jgi:hypothetical protein
MKKNRELRKARFRGLMNKKKRIKSRVQKAHYSRRRRSTNFLLVEIASRAHSIFSDSIPPSNNNLFIN